MINLTLIHIVSSRHFPFTGRESPSPIRRGYPFLLCYNIIMRIGIDVRMIFPFPTGIGNYRKSLMDALFAIDKKNEYVLVGNGKQQSEFLPLRQTGSRQLENKNVSFGVVRSRANHPLQHLTLSGELQSLNLDIFYTTPWGATLGIPCKYVLEIPDLIYHHYPGFGSWKSKLYEIFLEKSIARNADHIVTISDFVKNDIHEFLGVDTNKISNMKGDVSSDYRVIEDEGFINKVLNKYGLVKEIATTTSSSRNDKGIEEVPLTRGIKGVNPSCPPLIRGEIYPYFVYLGNQRPHKNLVGLLKAFELFRSTPLNPPLSGGQMPKLVIIGGVDAKGRDQDSLRIKEQLEKMKFKDDVMLLGKVFDNNEVAAIFSRAIAMVHPSLHEGFGMTPLEAMRCGCPIIASNVSAMPEVVGYSGMLVDPMDESSIANAMEKVFSDQNLRISLKEKSLKQSMLFSWEKTARMLLDVFEKTK